MKSTAQGSDDDDDDDIDEDLGDSDEEGGGMLLSDILTQTLRKEAASKGGMSQAEAAAQSLAAQRASSGAQGGGDSDSSASDVDSALEDSSDDDNSGGEDGGHAKMMSMVDKLVAGSTKRVKRKGSARVAEAIEPLAEAEYNLAPDRGGLAGGLSLEALVGSLRNTTQYGGLKRKLDALGSGPAPLQAPAGRVVEERASRQVQYQLTTKDVTKWQPLVAANRRAPHLAFDHEQPHAPKLSVAALHDKFLPATSLEKDVAKLLNRSGLGDNKAVRAAETDELQVNEVSAEEIKKRHGQLQKLKALLFYDELKKRRANKIKSKAYRRVKKRQEKRKAEKQREELRRLDPEAAAKLDEQDAMDIARARITLKHRNKGKVRSRPSPLGGCQSRGVWGLTGLLCGTSRGVRQWMKWAMKHGGAREESNRVRWPALTTPCLALSRAPAHCCPHTTQEGLAAAHARPEELRRKMERMAGDAGASDSSESDGDSDESEGARRKRKLGQYVDRARGLLDDGSDDGAGEGGGKPTGIHALKFMQDVTQRRREQARKEAAALVTELEALADDPDGKGKGKGKGKGEGNNSQTPTGRRSFAGSKVGGGNKWGEGLNAGTLEEKLQADKDMAAALGGGSGGGRVGLQVQQLRSSASNKVRMDGAITVDGVDSGVADGGADSDGSSGDSDGSDGSDGAGNDGGKGGDSKAAENPWMARKSKRANKSRKATAARLPVADVLKAIGSSGDGDAQAKASSNAAASGKGDAEWGSVVDGEWKKGGKQSNNGKGKGKGDKANGKSDEGALHQTEATRAERKRKAAQQELVRRAFAGVGADEEFAAEKEKIADDAAPKPEPAAKAGWGSWTGKVRTAAALCLDA